MHAQKYASITLKHLNSSYPKLEKLRNLLQPLMQWKKVTLKELESAVGLISFRSRAIPSSRIFLRRFYDLMLYAKRP
jgi:hypothetical protein